MKPQGRGSKVHVANALILLTSVVILLSSNWNSFPPTGSTALGAGSGGGPSVLNYEFQLNPQLVEIEHDEATGYDEISYPGLPAFALASLEGAPTLPALQPTVLLPQGSRLSRLTVLPSQRVLVAENVMPKPIPSLEGGGGVDGEPDPYFFDDGQVFPPEVGYKGLPFPPGGGSDGNP